MENKSRKSILVHQFFFYIYKLSFFSLHEAKWIEGEGAEWKGQLFNVAVLQAFQLQQCQTHLGEDEAGQSNHSFPAFHLLFSSFDPTHASQIPDASTLNLTPSLSVPEPTADCL